ncbi:hypothetical protein [Janthinobacterium sp.]|uniref:hypothetical protein n=1 Tax=Janthinobacterium sp. TaxID=1871054 RepID=UPI00293D1FC8|nr:hypothetical protein [Janthinobacterium sp.]
MTTNKRIILVLIGLIAAGLLLAYGYVWVTLHVSYSEGERAGYLQKFSKRGWVCKTWEGEIMLTTLPGTIPEKFLFTVRDEDVAKQFMAATGKRVLLSYAQHKGVPTSCFGETDYYAEKVQLSQ